MKKCIADRRLHKICGNEQADDQVKASGKGQCAKENTFSPLALYGAFLFTHKFFVHIYTLRLIVKKKVTKV